MSSKESDSSKRRKPIPSKRRKISPKYGTHHFVESIKWLLSIIASKNSSRILYVIKTSKNEKIVKSLDVINTSKIISDLINASKVNTPSTSKRRKNLYVIIPSKSVSQPFKTSKSCKSSKRRKLIQKFQMSSKRRIYQSQNPSKRRNLFLCYFRRYVDIPPEGILQNVENEFKESDSSKRRKSTAP